MQEHGYSKHGYSKHAPQVSQTFYCSLQCDAQAVMLTGVRPVLDSHMPALACTLSVGVGLLIGCNMHRGDAHKMPQHLMELCEVEPLRQEEAGSSRWVLVGRWWEVAC